MANESLRGDKDGQKTPLPVFRPAFEHYNRPGLIVTFGPYLGVAPLLDAAGARRYTQFVREQSAATGYQIDTLATPLDADQSARERAVRWTRWVNALNAGRTWPVTRLAERLDREVSPGVAVVIVPAHDPFVTNSPIRGLARAVASLSDRTDATACLVRHTKIKRITWGGPSHKQIHRATIRVDTPELIVGQSVLLLDDIARSGASLRACEGLLYEAGASRVQSVALGRVVG